MMRQITETDFQQREFLSDEELRGYKGLEELDQIMSDFKERLERFEKNISLFSGLQGAVAMLMFLGKSNEEIVGIGRAYVVEYITSSVGVMQMLLKDISDATVVTNNIKVFESISLIKQILKTLIDDFGIKSK